MLTIVVNRKSGTARRMGRGELRQRLIESCARAGIADPVIRIVHPKRIDGVLRDACASGGEVWVGGGDGTLRTAATLLRDSGGTLGVLPLGTMNLLARDLGIPLELEEAVLALADAPAEYIDVGLMNGEVFLNKSALGLYPEMIIDRERRRRLFGYGKWPAMFRAMWRAIRRHRMMEATLIVDGQERRIVTPAMIVATSEYEFRTGRLFRRPSLRDGLLTVYISHERGWFGTLGQLVKMWMGTITRDPEMEILRTPSLDIAFKRSRPVANDGEVEFVRGPVHYAVDPSGLKVRHPAAAEPGDASATGAESAPLSA